MKLYLTIPNNNNRYKKIIAIPNIIYTSATEMELNISTPDLYLDAMYVCTIYVCMYYIRIHRNCT